MREIMRISCAALQAASKSARKLLWQPDGSVLERTGTYQLPGMGPKVPMLGQATASSVFARFYSKDEPSDDERNNQAATIRVKVGPNEQTYSGKTPAWQVLGDLSARYGAGRLSTAKGVVVLNPSLLLKKGKYFYEPNPVIDFAFRWETSNDEVMEDTVRLKDQADLNRLLQTYGAASFRAVGSKGPSLMKIEDIDRDKCYDLVHAGRRNYALEVSHALDTLGKGEEDKTGEALLHVFGKQDGVSDAYLLPTMRHYTVEKHEPHYGEEGASQEWDAAAVVKREKQAELLLAEHKRRLKASDVRNMAVRLRRAIERSRDPHTWRAYSGLAAFDRVRAICSTKDIAPSEKKKVKRASEECDIPVLLENGCDLSIGSALLNLEGD